MKALFEQGKARGYVTFDEIDEALPDGAEASDWITALEEEHIDVVPHASLRPGDVDSPDEPYFVTEVEVAIDDLTTEGLLYWAPYATWDDDAVDRVVLALAGVKIDHAQRDVADRATARGFQVTKGKTGLAIDLRARPGARIEIGIDGYAADRGSFASIAPTRVELVDASRIESEEATYVIADAGTPVLPLRLTAPLFVGDVSDGEVEIEAAFRIESREWGLKWLDVLPLRCSGATLVDGSLELQGAKGCRLAIELVQDGHALRFVAAGLHLSPAAL